MNLTANTFNYGDNKTLAYLDGGPVDGPLIIFMHGWPAIGKTWTPQLNTFSSLGYRVIAPDMPGYGGSTSRHVFEDYSIETVVTGMLALLAHVGYKQAVWIGHDWGTGPLWGIASHHPEVVKGIVGMTVPYRTLELGLEELLKYVNRTIYPKERYPYGQWGYQAYYLQEFEKATAWLDQDPAGYLKAAYAKGDPSKVGTPAPLADVVRDGGRYGGRPNAPSVDETPDDATTLKGEQLKETAAAMTKTGFWGPDAWYMNHPRNRAYTLEKSVNNGVLEMPVLFVEAQYDLVCDTKQSTLADPMREYTKDLTYVSVKAGHWVAEEKPEEVSSAIAKWLVERVSDYWPYDSSKKTAVYRE